MTKIISKLNTSGTAYRNNCAKMAELVADLDFNIEQIKRAGSKKSRDQHIGGGKMLVRDRVKHLLD